MTWTRHDEATPDGAFPEEAAATAQRTRRAFLAGAGGVLATAVLVAGERSRAGATETAITGVGGRAAAPAGAPQTPPVGLSPKPLGRGTVTRGGTIDVPQGKDVVVNAASIAPGGDSGWHTHPGDEMIMVTGGSLTFLSLDGLICKTEEVKAGQAFLGAAAGQVHTAFNHGSVPVDFVVAFFGVPVGDPPRNDAEKPLGVNCG